MHHAMRAGTRAVEEGQYICDELVGQRLTSEHAEVLCLRKSEQGT